MKTILCLFLAIFFVGCSDHFQRSNVGDCVAVRAERVRKVNDIVGSNYIGTIHPQKSTSISSKFPGKLISLNVSQGDVVSEGDIIAVIESQSVKSAYIIAEATLRQAEDGYRRLSQVRKTNSVADVKVVEIETQVAKARAAYESARQSLEDCNIKAPFNGIVGEILMSEGVELTPFEDIMKILDVSSLEIKISVPEKEIGRMHIGDSVSFTVPALSDTCLNAVVASKGVVASRFSHSYDCTLDMVSYPAELMPGMVTKVYFSQRGNARIVVPASIIRFDNHGKYIWCIEDGLVYKQYVTMGDFYEKGIIVTDGLHDGDSILIEGTQKVSIGTRVKIIE